MVRLNHWHAGSYLSTQEPPNGFAAAVGAAPLAARAMNLTIEMPGIRKAIDSSFSYRGECGVATSNVTDKVFLCRQLRIRMPLAPGARLVEGRELPRMLRKYCSAAA